MNTLLENYHEIREAAEAEMRSLATPSQAALLESDLTAWSSALSSMLEDVDAQAAAKRADLATQEASILDRDLPEHTEKTLIAEARAEYADWQRRSSGFRRHVQRRLRALKTTIAEQNQDRHADLVVADRNRLLDAISDHRRRLAADGVEATEADRSLYRLAEEVETAIGLEREHAAA